MKALSHLVLLFFCASRFLTCCIDPHLNVESGQTKMKSVLMDFLVSAGIKPTSIVSYNHLGNNDGKNLSAPQQFRSKEISKSNVVDDMVNSNRLDFVLVCSAFMVRVRSEGFVGFKFLMRFLDFCFFF